jgi:hypothetical protein
MWNEDGSDRDGQEHWQRHQEALIATRYRRYRSAATWDAVEAARTKHRSGDLSQKLSNPALGRTCSSC